MKDTPDQSPTMPEPVVGWQPIGGAPRDGSRFLAVQGNGIMRVDRLNLEKQSSSARTFWEENPAKPYTHWMPLPEAPK